MKKKMIALLLALALAASLGACSGQKKASSLDLAAAKDRIEALGSFSSLVDPDDSQLKDSFGIDPALISRRAAGIPLVNVQASMYWLVLAKDADSAKQLKEQFSAYFESYQKLWDSYLPEQAALVRAHIEREYDTEEGVWLLYAVADDTDAVEKAVEDSLVY